MINDVLVPKYLGHCHSEYGKKTKFDLLDDEKIEVKNFLAIHQDNINLISDPKLLLTFLMLLDPLPCFDYFNQNMQPPPHFTHKIRPPQPHHLKASAVCLWLPAPSTTFVSRDINSFLQYCCGVKDDQLVTAFEKFYNQLLEKINDENILSWRKVEDKERVKVRQEVMEALNKMLVAGDLQLFNIETDGKVLDFQIPEWFTILRQLAHFELKEWERKAPLVEQFISHLNAANATLEEEDGKFYAGLAIAPYTVSLIRTTEKNAVDRKDLIQFLKEEYETYESKIKASELIKLHLSTLEGTAKWLDDVFKFAHEQGREKWRKMRIS